MDPTTNAFGATTGKLNPANQPRKPAKYGRKTTMRTSNSAKFPDRERYSWSAPRRGRGRMRWISFATAMHFRRLCSPLAATLSWMINESSGVKVQAEQAYQVEQSSVVTASCTSISQALR